MIEGESRILDRVSADSKLFVKKLQRLQRIAVALSAEHDLGRLLSFILQSARELTCSDAGSIFVREDEIEINADATGRDKLYESTPYLTLKTAQNDSVKLPFKEMKLSFDTSSIAGYVAISGEILNLEDAYAITETRPFRHRTAFDKQSGYKCKSMLVIPMQNIEGDVIGTIQLINKKTSPEQKLTAVEDVNKYVCSYDEIDEELMISLASQAAVGIEKASLYEQIKQMFRGFVSSLTLALEKRNYTTFGHCMRIRDYALTIAREFNTDPPAKYKNISFTDEQLEELEYAALLHDIGKLSIRDEILDKRNKLTDDQIRVITCRFNYIKQLDTQKKPNLQKLDWYLEQLKRINIPLGLTDEDKKTLNEIKDARFTDIDGKEKPLITDFEYENLAIPRGNLTLSERKEVERHITETWEILKRIPWPKDLQGIPNISATHHEKIDASGYPWQLKENEIPIGGKILAIADIFEALTAQDRPYKPPFHLNDAVKILDDEVKKGKLDKDLYDLFVSKKLYLVHIDEQTGHLKPESTRF